MHLIIDAHNLKSGGGRVHVRALLEHTSTPHPFQKVTVVCHPLLARELTPLRSGRPWLAVLGIDHLARNLAARRLWHDHAFPKLVARQGADVLFAPGGILPARLPGGTAAVVLVQNMLLFQRREAARYGPGLERLRLTRLRRRVFSALRRADGVIFPSRFGRYMATCAVPRRGGRVAVIPNGVDPRFRDPDPASRTRRAPKRLLYVSTMDVYKHQDMVVRALGLLRQQGYRDLHLDLVGPPRQPMYRRVCRAIDEMGLHGVVQVTPWVPHEALPDWYFEADIGVFASSSETCPNILLEMMAAGVPTVCSDRLPMPDFCMDAAEYADPEDPEALARAVAGLLEDEEKRIRKGLDLATRARCYDWKACARQTLEFLAGTVQDRR